MKKLTLILAALVLFAGVSFAQSTPAKPPAKAKTEKKAKKAKKVKEVPAKKADKKAAATPAAK